MRQEKGIMSDGVQGQAGSAARVALSASPERRLLPPHGGARHVDFRIAVEALTKAGGTGREPLTLALVLDRSGSMHGDKLATAKRAALAVLGRLSECDRVAVVVFDDRIDVLQAAAPATAGVKSAIREALTGVPARGTTALHEGWLTACRAIAADGQAPPAGPARCFLLTDGLANVGLTEPEAIAAAAAQVREHAGIGTSTFGIGADYDEGLLGPMAVAGGGQFHHLRQAGEIASTFVGELGEMLAIVAGQVRLELELAPGVSAEVVSAYWPSDMEGGGLSVGIGDLLGGEERHVVAALNFPAGSVGDSRAVRARVVWAGGGAQHAGDWCEVQFRYAVAQECDAEAYDPAVMHWAGLHHAERAKEEAIKLNRRGDLQGAKTRLEDTEQLLVRYALADLDIHAALQELRTMEGHVAAPMPSLAAKEARARAQRTSRGQRDLRGPERTEAGDERESS